MQLTRTPTEQLSGAALARELGARAAKGQIEYTYAAAAEELFVNIDDVTTHNGVLDAYTGAMHTISDRDDAHKRHLNVEHTWPRSRGAKGIAGSDLHHLRAVNADANSARSSYMLGELSPDAVITFTTRGGPWQSRLGREGSTYVFEPPAEVRGDIARGLMYFAVRYGTGQAGSDDAFTGATFLTELPTLLRWHATDPVTDAERARNDRVEEFQGNRNPFVDDPALALRIGEEGFRSALG